MPRLDRHCDRQRRARELASPNPERLAWDDGRRCPARRCGLRSCSRLEAGQWLRDEWPRGRDRSDRERDLPGGTLHPGRATDGPRGGNQRLHREEPRTGAGRRRPSVRRGARWVRRLLCRRVLHAGRDGRPPKPGPHPEQWQRRSGIQPGPRCSRRRARVSGSTVYAGGSFTSIGGQARNSIAALDATTGAATSWNPNADSGSRMPRRRPRRLRLDRLRGRQLHARSAARPATASPPSTRPPAPRRAGTRTPTATTSTRSPSPARPSTPAATSPRSAARRRNTSPPSTRPPARRRAGTRTPSGNVYALAVSGSTVYAGGDFSSIGGQTRNGIAALDADDRRGDEPGTRTQTSDAAVVTPSPSPARPSTPAATSPRSAARPATGSPRSTRRPARRRPGTRTPNDAGRRSRRLRLDRLRRRRLHLDRRPGPQPHRRPRRDHRRGDELEPERNHTPYGRTPSTRSPSPARPSTPAALHHDRRPGAQQDRRPRRRPPAR